MNDHFFLIEIENSKKNLDKFCSSKGKAHYLYSIFTNSEPVVPEFYTKKRESPEKEDAVSSLRSKAFMTAFRTVALMDYPVASWMTFL